MRKLIKISALILFIIFVLGITTSNAAFSVKEDTTAITMLEKLNEGTKLTSISNKLKDKNAYLYCRQRNLWLWHDAEYSLESEEPTVYPTDDQENGYARAYILAAPGYEDINGQLIPYVKNDSNYGAPTKEDERQYAWHCIDGEISDKNDLYNLAIAYQNYKKRETDVTLTAIAEANTTISGDNIVYGPLKVEYTYAYAKSNSKFDEWGGFNYAFFDINNNNISNKVKFCILSDNTYTEIESELISSTDETNGYYKVCTEDYNGEDLYIVTNDKNLTDVNIKVQANIVDYEAEVYLLEGKVHIDNAGLNYCTNCRHRIVSVEEAIGDSNALVQQGGVLYKWSRTETNDDVVGLSGTIKNYYYYGETKVVAGTASAMYPHSSDWYYGFGTNPWTDWTLARNSLRNYIGYAWVCNGCGTQMSTQSDIEAHAATHVRPVRPYVHYQQINYFTPYNGCGIQMVGGKSPIKCGSSYTAGTHNSQDLLLVNTTSINKSVGEDLNIEIELAVTIEVTKTWDDASNVEQIRPDGINLKVYRSIDQTNWTLLKNGEDYTIDWQDKDGDTWKAYISGLMRIDENGNNYYFKVVEETISVYYEVSYKSGNYTDGKIANTDLKAITITNTKLIDLGGYVWLDGQTGVKPAVPNNGIMDEAETRLENIVVRLYKKGAAKPIAETVTDSNGHYIFEKLYMDYYYVEFEYDGVHYEDTIKPENASSKAFENDANRNTFNGRFKTITYGQSNDGTKLNYNYEDKKSTLITNTEGTTRIASEFIMNATTVEELHSSTIDNLNLGLVKRGTDIALSTDVYDAKVSINGQATDYKFNKEDNSVEIGTTQSSEEASYNLNLYASDYNYRIRDYITNDGFKENDYINEEEPSGLKTGQDLQVSVVYELNLQNQGTKTTKINEVKYVYDEKYTFKGIVDNSCNATDTNNVLTLNLNGLALGDGETKTIYIEFLVKENDNAVTQGNFSNKAEVTSYSTDEGLIDADSQPGNFINDNQVEDDNDTAGGLTIKTEDNFVRKITGKVFDKEGNNVNDVIVQLIELKPFNGKVYEYIWQETVSGTEKGLRLNGNGTALEEYSYNKADGYYEFKGFIPGDYIVRFIYGDGTTYDMTGNVIKYNGQDYKSMPDANYNAEWYNDVLYNEGASVARDNEARRLETMAYSVEINSVKGVLLKLLNNVSADKLNLTEKEVLVATYNHYYDPDITVTKIEDVSDDNINNAINKLLKEQVLKNTWMCAETSKIKVAVDTDDVTNIATGTEVDGVAGTYVSQIGNINLGLELRPVTKIELEKYITGFKLIASNGQTLVNAHVDVNEYLTDEYEENPLYIINKIQGVKDNVTILDTIWQYEVLPTDINTIVDGASLEFEYTLVVKNTGETDYIGPYLAQTYDMRFEDYVNELKLCSSEIKQKIRTNTFNYANGTYLGTAYYTEDSSNSYENIKVMTEVTKIRDYVNNDLTFITSGDVAIDESASKTHRILRDDYSMQEATVNTILKTTKTTGKMENDGKAVMYKVTLRKNPISSTGNLNFENYIAEVMSYTNAAGRRSMTSTPGNAEIIDHEKREGKSHEIDEADTGRIQIGVATGEDVKTNYIIIIAVSMGIAVVALGTYIVKKYILK